jgi:predicted ArsR family transcriptional regulator
VGFEEDVELLGALVEPQRRRIYDELLKAPEPRTLSDLAAELDLGRTLTAFHINKLVTAGLIEVLPAQSGDGRRGRPSQRYRISRREIEASVPPRRYDLVASVLLDAARTQQPGESVLDASRRTGRARGAELARAEPARRGAPLRRVERLLARLGYAPARTEGTLVLRNCPFDKLAESDRDIVCGINHALAEGYVAGSDASDALDATLRPCPDNCCVVISTKPA